LSAKNEEKNEWSNSHLSVSGINKPITDSRCCFFLYKSFQKVESDMSNIFYNIEPKVINTELACLLGLNEAIVLQQLHYWIEKNKATATNFHDGRYWTYGTVQEYRDRDFRFWSFDTVKRTFAKLIKLGFVLQGNYNKIKLDQTKWYSINYIFLEEWITENASVPDNTPLVQNAPMEQGNLPQCNRAKSAFPTGQNAPLHQSISHQSNRAACTSPSGQNATMQQGSLPHAIPENKKQIKHKRLTNKTNTQRAATPAAGGSVSTTTAAIGEIVEPVELLFDAFWKLYPRKESKQQAKKAWLKLNPDQALFDLIANALEYRSQSKEWLAENGRYIPHPATWLNGRRWEDELAPQKLCESAALQEKYGGIRIDGKPLDPVQKKQLEYIEK